MDMVPACKICGRLQGQEGSPNNLTRIGPPKESLYEQSEECNMRNQC